jgi:hypothetical protein
VLTERGVSLAHRGRGLISVWVRQHTGGVGTRSPKTGLTLQRLITLGYMARIRKLEQGTQSIRPHSTEVDCFYNVVQADDGTKLLHLTTFGSDDRASKAKSSQSIQIDGTIARQLVAILADTFPRSLPRTPKSDVEP